jgi:hypothetical protein
MKVHITSLVRKNQNRYLTMELEDDILIHVVTTNNPFEKEF